jgi:hypothetical protein
MQISALHARAPTHAVVRLVPADARLVPADAHVDGDHSCPLRLPLMWGPLRPLPAPANAAT